MSATSYTSTKYCLLFVVKKLFSTVFVGFKCSYKEQGTSCNKSILY